MFSATGGRTSVIAVQIAIFLILGVHQSATTATRLATLLVLVPMRLFSEPNPFLCQRLFL